MNASNPPELRECRCPVFGSEKVSGEGREGVKARNVCKNASHMRKGLSGRNNRASPWMRRQCWTAIQTNRMCSKHGGLWFSIVNPPWSAP